MTRPKGPEAIESSFIEYHAGVKKSKTHKRLINNAINKRYRELLELRAQLHEAEDRLIGEASRLPWPPVF